MARQSPLDVAASDHFASNGSPAPAIKPASADGLLEEFLRYGRPDLPIDGVDGEKLIRQVVDLARILTGASGSALAFRGEHGTICRATSGKGAPPIGASVDGSSGITRQCLDSGISVRCDDIATDRRVDPSIIQTVGIRAVAVVPIHREWDVIGILEVVSTTPGNFTFQHLKRLQQLAGWVGSASKALQNPLVLVPSVSSTSVRSEKRNPPQVTRESLVLPPATHTEKSAHGEMGAQNSGVKSVGELGGWNAVLLPDTHLPWKRFVQSVFFHVMLVGMFWSFSEFGPHELDLSMRPHREDRITYYPLSQSAPQRGISSAAKIARASHVRGQQKPKAPTGKSQQVASTPAAAVGKSEIDKPKVQAAAAPMPGLPSARLSRLRSELKTVAPVSPQPGMDGIQTRRSQGSNPSVVAPAPEIATAAGSRRTNLSGGGAAVIPPPPEVGHLRGGGSTESVDISIVPPPPAIGDHATLSYRSSGIVSKNGTQIIAPAPSFEGRTKLGAGGNALLPNGGVAQLVPPPASLDGSGGLGRSGQRRGASLAQGNSEIVAPAPSLLGDGNGSGKGREATRMASLGNGGPQVVPPAPAVQVGANYRDGSRNGILGGSGSAVVGPAPSGNGVGYGLGGRGNSLAGGSQIVGPPPSLGVGAGEGRSNSGSADLSARAGVEGLPPEPSKASPGSGTAAGGDDRNTAPASKANDDVAATHPVFQDAQVQVISLAWAPPRSSYFSSFEVFIAQKWVSKDKTEMIKLVYVFLPYQRRLSEYGVENPKIRRLRVTRDPSCDESLMQLAWPEGRDKSASNPAAMNGSGSGSSNPGSVTLEDRNLLPCYRTTADEYRHAVSRNR